MGFEPADSEEDRLAAAEPGSVQASPPLLPGAWTSFPSLARTAILEHWITISGYVEGIAVERPALDQVEVDAAERALVATEVFGAEICEASGARAHGGQAKSLCYSSRRQRLQGCRQSL